MECYVFFKYIHVNVNICVYDLNKINYILNETYFSMITCLYNKSKCEVGY